MNIGYVALFLALVAAIYSVGAYVVGARRKHPPLLQSARNGVLAVFGLMSISTGAILYALLTHNYRIAYVASYSSNDMSVLYLISSLWAGNDGSLLFWAWLLSVFAAVAVLQRRQRGRQLVPYAATVMMVIQAFFVTVLLVAANPFRELSYTPADGRGLNPLLENPGMLVHPPFLLAGYVGLTLPFAFAIAALVTRRLGDEWIVTIRRWTLIAWLFLGIGNLLGAWWAYVELGWGGYWAWDPVENASLMPWLVVTAFLHSVMMQRRRGMLKIWNMVLVILSFELAMLGTFLVRSSVLASVHTFAESPLLGTLFLGFIMATMFGAFGLLYYRSEDLKSEAEMESLVSRESTFLLNNLLLVGAAFAILLGTFFPVISEAVRGVKVTVGAPFYNQVNGPIFLAIILLSGICTLIGWRRASRRNLVHNFLWPAVAAVLLGVVLFVVGIRAWYALVAFVMFAFVVGTIFYEWFRGTRARHRMRGDNYAKAFAGLIMSNRARYGGYIVHIGIVIMALGVVGSSFYDVEQDVVLKPGESVAIQDYTVTFDSIDSYSTASKDVVTAVMSVREGQRLIGRLTPEKYFHRSYEQPVTEVAIRSTFAEDLYVILINWDQEGSTAFKVLINPLVQWIWIGGWVLVVGGVTAFWPERQKAPAPQEKTASAEAERRREKDEVEEVR